MQSKMQERGLLFTASLSGRFPFNRNKQKQGHKACQEMCWVSAASAIIPDWLSVLLWYEWADSLVWRRLAWLDLTLTLLHLQAIESILYSTNNHNLQNQCWPSMTGKRATKHSALTRVASLLARDKCSSYSTPPSITVCLMAETNVVELYLAMFFINLHSLPTREGLLLLKVWTGYFGSSTLKFSARGQIVSTWFSAI